MSYLISWGGGKVGVMGKGGALEDGNSLLRDLFRKWERDGEVVSLSPTERSVRGTQSDTLSTSHLTVEARIQVLEMQGFEVKVLDQ